MTVVAGVDVGDLPHGLLRAAALHEPPREERRPARDQALLRRGADGAPHRWSCSCSASGALVGHGHMMQDDPPRLHGLLVQRLRAARRCSSGCSRRAPASSGAHPAGPAREQLLRAGEPRLERPRRDRRELRALAAPRQESPAPGGAVRCEPGGHGHRGAQLADALGEERLKKVHGSPAYAAQGWAPAQGHGAEPHRDDRRGRRRLANYPASAARAET